MDSIADPRPGPDRWLEARQQYALVRQALNDMPERYRKALLLNRLHGLTHAQIGAQFGVSTSMATKYVRGIAARQANARVLMAEVNQAVYRSLIVQAQKHGLSLEASDFAVSKASEIQCDQPVAASLAKPFSLAQ